MITQQGWKAYPVRTSSWAEAGERRRSQEYGRLTNPGRPAWHQGGPARNRKAGFNKAQPSGRLPARTRAGRAVRESPRSLAGRVSGGPYRRAPLTRPWGCVRMKHPEENASALSLQVIQSLTSEAAMAPPGAAPATVRTGPGHQAQPEPDRDSDRLIGDDFCSPIFPF